MVYFLILSHFSLLKFSGLSLEQLNFYYAYLNKYLENTCNSESKYIFNVYIQIEDSLLVPQSRDTHVIQSASQRTSSMLKIKRGYFLAWVSFVSHKYFDSRQHCFPDEVQDWLIIGFLIQRSTERTYIHFAPFADDWTPV